MKNKKGKLHRSVIPFLFICPVIVMNLIFFCLPFLQSLAMSFFEWPLLGEKTFVGLGNYQTLLADDQFRTSLLFTMKYTLFVTPALFLMAFILALLIDGKFKGVTLFRTIYFSPVVISMTSCSLIDLSRYFFQVHCTCHPNELHGTAGASASCVPGELPLHQPDRFKGRSDDPSEIY